MNTAEQLNQVTAIENKFSAHYDAVEQEIKASTVGLVTIDQMKQTQERARVERERKLVQHEKDVRKKEKEKLKAKEKAKEKEKKKMKALSFNPDDEEEEDEDEDPRSEKKTPVKRRSNEAEGNTEEVSPEVKRKRFGMNPDVDTAFLPDRERDAQENMMREKLRQEWETRQRTLKDEDVEITYSYWDGSGHRKTITMKKGNTIYQFLCKVLDSIRKEFPELKIVTGDQLMFVKEDLIIPQTNTFYDFIVSNARGKTGPLFNFDHYEDVRIQQDASIEKDESHAGKVVLRSW